MSNEILFLNEPDDTIKRKNEKKTKKDKKPENIKSEETKVIDKDEKNSNSTGSIKNEVNNLQKQESKPDVTSKDENNDSQNKNIEIKKEPDELTILENVLQRKKKETKYLKKKKIELDFKLNDILDKVNESIERSHGIVKNRMKASNLSDVMMRIENLTQESISTKKQLSSYKQKYEIMKKQSSESFSNDKMLEIEEKISNIKEDNDNLTKKINIFKSKHTQKSKELEVYQKEYPLKISNLTEQLDNLATKKFKYFNNLNNNKKSLKNLRTFLEGIQKLFNNYASKHGTNQKEIDKIQDVLLRIHDHLKYPEDEIIMKINNGDVIYDDLPISHNFSNENDKIKDQNNPVRNKLYRSLSPSNRDKVNSKTLPIIAPKLKNESRLNKPHLLSLNKFEYLTQKEMVTKPNYMKINRKQTKLNEEKTKDEEDGKNSENTISEVDENKENEDEIRRSFYTSSDEEIPEIKDLEKMDKLLNLELKYDYEKSTEEDFTYLIKKNEEFIALNEKILKLVKKADNTYEKKIKKNRHKELEVIRKTNVLKQQNDLLSEEIKDLTRLLKLGYEERQLIKMGKGNQSIIKEKELEKNKNKELKESIKPKVKEGYVFFTSRPPEYYIEKNKTDKKKKNGKTLNTSQISRIKEKSQQDSRLSNEENEFNNEDDEIENTEENYNSNDKVDLQNLNKIKQLKLKNSPNNSDVDLNEIKKKYNLKDINK